MIKEKLKCNRQFLVADVKWVGDAYRRAWDLSNKTVPVTIKISLLSV